MRLDDYIGHYLETKNLLIMFCVSTTLILLVHLLIWLFSKKTNGNVIKHFEAFYEMIISSTAMLLFIGLYFLVEYRYFDIDDEFYKIWDKNSDFILLLALFISVVLMNILDRVLISLKTISKDKRSILRMMAMIYMLIVFAYIKFIYEDSNYDSIIKYFIIMMLGRYIYFDASFRDFLMNLKDMFFLSPILMLSLAVTAGIAFYGFKSGYLLKSNGVVLSLCIAHIFFTVEILIAHLLERVFKKC